MKKSILTIAIILTILFQNTASAKPWWVYALKDASGAFSGASAVGQFCPHPLAIVAGALIGGVGASLDLVIPFDGPHDITPKHNLIEVPISSINTMEEIGKKHNIIIDEYIKGFKNSKGLDFMYNNLKNMISIKFPIYSDDCVNTRLEFIPLIENFRKLNLSENNRIVNLFNIDNDNFNKQFLIALDKLKATTTIDEFYNEFVIIEKNILTQKELNESELEQVSIFLSVLKYSAFYWNSVN